MNYSANTDRHSSKTILPLTKHGFAASQLVLGFMAHGGGWNDNPVTLSELKRAHDAVETALSVGINMFDHADIYSKGKAELLFGQVLKERPEIRDKIIIQSKCGIRAAEGPIPSRFDFSKDHIIASADGILNRLGLEKLDILLLHRPDPLIEPEEVAEAFRQLKATGKVDRFGVSNMSAGQMKLLEAYLDEPLVANQLELNLLKLDWLEAGIYMNHSEGKDYSFPDGTIEHCRLLNVQLQAYSPLARGLFSGGDRSNASAAVQETAALVARMAEEKDTTKEAIVLSFLLRHPAHIQPVIGTADPDRIRACSEAMKVNLSHGEWYQLYVTSRGRGMP
ncbi:aldo/keto reductase [Paenibacillus psychroresistens]|uniref:Aldo/keto reductase n=1 Tax=Paenibacillus psychroresistens TaxID=1778678 RepID=A0A6B8RP08_9BACL|nr:aldo/keto reductase [Paenibacillus psychroresistens]QGQ97587.1 aldo/keto reductase [Paenibacillus psychroresistens]